jgi:ubiquinone/menaquinone biosynthesis C-methylase UbiE
MYPSESFFDTIADFYDKMTSFEKALSIRTNAYKKILSKGKGRAADLGCGTGLDTIALALNGMQVTAFDLSRGMLDKAEEKTKGLNLNIEFYNYSLDAIPEKFNNLFTLAVSMGNTLANLDRPAIKKAIKNSFQMLQPGGKFLMQILNYEKITKAKERIVNITHDGDKYYVRFYDFQDDAIDFNILSFDERELSNKHLVTTKIYPYSSDLMKQLLLEEGYRNIEFFGSLNMDIFDSGRSKDIVITAEK